MERGLTTGDASPRGILRGILVRSRPLLRALREPAVLFSGIVIVLAIVCAIAPSFVAPFPPNQQSLSARLVPPFTADAAGHFHLLGTDWLGRDMLSRIVFGARITVGLALLNVAVRTMFGTLMGLLGGFLGGLIDTIVMRLADIQLALPFLLLGIALAAVSGPSVLNVVIVLGATGWMVSARVVRSEVLSLKESAFIEAARATGANSARLMFRHVLPNVSTTIIVLATLDIPTVILAESVLSFLGVGVPLSMPSWGAMISLGRGHLSTAWWVPVMPGAAIALLAAAVTVVGDYWRGRLDPTYARKRR